MLDWLPADWTLVERRFYRRHPTAVAPDLLNKILLRRDGRAARIVEVEAYAGSEDPAAVGMRGRTARTASLFGEAGHLYVHFSHGLHWGSNVVCGEPGQGWGVLLRAAEVLRGREAMRAARPKAKSDRDLATGPARLSAAFGIDRAFDGADLVGADRGIALVCDGRPPPADPVVGPRIGISRAVDFPWRWHLANNPHVSAPRGRR